MKNISWVLFGFSGAIADIFDVIDSNYQSLSKIVLNLNPMPDMHKYLSLYHHSIEVLTLDKFKMNPEEVYNFCFFLPQKKALLEHLHQLFNIKFSNLIHKSAVLSNFAEYGEGLLVGPSAIVTAGAAIGNHIRLNRGATIGHDTRIGDFTHIGPNVTIAGCCKVGEGNFIGAGTVVKDRITIGNNTIIGAGSLVIKDVPDNVVVFGSPARVIRKNV